MYAFIADPLATSMKLLNHVQPQLPQTLAKNGYDIVYGGGHVGLMGIIADSALAAGSKVYGVIPSDLHAREVQHTGLTELHIVHNMHERKMMMSSRADAFIALPGGFGTLDEAFEILTWKQLGFHNKPIIFYNERGFWDPLIQLIHHIIEEGFAPKDNLDIFHVINKPEQLLGVLTAPPDPVVDLSKKW